MNALNDHYLVPDQQEGIEKNLQSYITALTVEDAEDMFVEAKNKMLDINNWKKENSYFKDFVLKDAHGKEVHRPARKGDFIHIANAAGDSWVHVDAIEYDDYPDINTEAIALRVHPCSAPDLHVNEEPYLINNAVSSTMVIERLDRRLTALYHGRNETIGGTANQADEAWQQLIYNFLLFDEE
ncbi:MAG: hypothetical protein ACTHJ0_05135 [Flavipsychrobacter sp.]